MTSRHPEPGHEEYETMPWSMLADEIDKGKHRTMALTIVAAVAVGILAFLVVRSIRQPPGTVVDVPAVATTVTAPAPVAGAVPTTSVAPASPVIPSTSTVPADAVVYSEEDLRAGVPDVDMRLAEVRAEWFVSDYFSTGPLGDGAMPEGATPRAIPDGAYSWVEWARASAVEASGGGRYDVTVVFRTLAGTGEGAIAATPPRAVVVPVFVDGDGGATVIDLPAPAALPPVASGDPVPAPDGEVPEAVASAALDRSAPLGSAEVVGGTQVDNGWRVVVAVTDRSGASFPVAVLVPG